MSIAPMIQSSVTIAQPQDADAVFALLRGLHQENGIFPMDDDLVRQRVRDACNRDGGVAGVIAGPKGIEASIGLFALSAWYTTALHLEDFWAFVSPDYRGPRYAGHARRLLEFAKRCAASLELPLMIGVLSSKRTEAKVRLYRRHFPEAGATFFYEPPGVKTRFAEIAAMLVSADEKAA